MEKDNNLSNTLKTLCRERGKSLAEFSSELGIPKTTMQSVINTGNTSLDTLIRLSNASGLSLDELVFGEVLAQYGIHVSTMLRNLDCYSKLPEKKQKLFRYHLDELLKLVGYDSERTADG